MGHDSESTTQIYLASLETVSYTHLTAIVNKVLHLDIQEQRLIGVLHIEGVETVSYTHLDVYKRQVKGKVKPNSLPIAFKL